MTRGVPSSGTRQSSGLVKKGKYVKALMELLGTGPKNAFQITHSTLYDCGPNWDYVKANLTKLLESGEVLSKDWQGPKEAKPFTYFYLGHNADGYDPEGVEGFWRTGVYEAESTEDAVTPVRTVPRPMPNDALTRTLVEYNASEDLVVKKQPIHFNKLPVERDEPTTVYLTQGEKLPRNSELETIISWAWLLDFPWENAAKYYVNSHKAKYMVADQGKKWGDRLVWEDEV